MGRRPAPCGTVSRYKRGCRCDACIAAWRSYYETIKVQARERAAAWRKANPEKRKVQAARHRERHRDKRNADALARYHRLMVEDPEKVRAGRRARAKTPKGVMANRFAAHKRRGVTLSPEGKAYAELILNDPCAYCGAPAVEIDHIDPVSAGGDGDWSNLTPACRTCNARKNDRPLLAHLVAA